jgi:5-methylcytosine-specific restriction endonuclease McrA
MTLSPARQKEYQREWCAKNRAAYMAGKSCVVCGSTQNLEVDHIEPEQKISHRIWSWSAVRRAAELAKCQILCTDCHLTKTLEQRPKPDHGTLSRYQRGKCRCEPCREANRLDSRQRREAHRLAA